MGALSTLILALAPAVLPGHWHLELDADSATARVEMQAEFLEEGELTLFPVGTVFRDLRKNGEPATSTQRDGWHVLRSSQGAIVVSVELPSDEGLRLRRMGFPIATVDLRSSQAMNWQIAGIGERQGRAVELALPGSMEELAVTWEPLQVLPARPGDLSITPSMAWTVAPQGLVANARLDLQIVGGDRQALELSLPPGADRVSLLGPEVREFSRQGDRLLVYLRGAIRGITRLQLGFVLPGRPSGEFTLPELGAPGARLVDGGWTLVANEVGGELLESEIDGLDPRGTREAPGDLISLLSAPLTYAYRRVSRTPQIRVDLVTTSPFPLVDTIADESTITCVRRPGGQELVRWELRMRNNRRQFVRVRLPVDARVLHLKVEGELRRASQDDDELLIPLVKSVQTIGGLIAFPIELIYTRPDSADSALDLPVLMDAPIAHAKLELRLPADEKLRKMEGPWEEAERGEKTEDFLTVGHGHRRVPAADGAPEGGVWEYSEDGGSSWQAIGAANATTANLVIHAWDQTARDATTDSVDISIMGNNGSSTLSSIRGGLQADLAANERLGRNYWKAGYKAYKDNRLEEAEEAFGNALSISNDANVRADAQALLDNIKAGRGEVSGGRETRAKAARIQKGLAGDNVKLFSRQRGLIEKAYKELEAGNELAAVVLFDDAGSLGEQLAGRGEGREQKQIGAEIAKKVSGVAEDARRNRALKVEFEELKREAQQVLQTKSKAAASLYLNVEKKTRDELLNTNTSGVDEALLAKQGKFKPEPQSLRDENAELEQQNKNLREALKNPQPPKPQAKVPALTVDTEFLGEVPVLGRLFRAQQELDVISNVASVGDAEQQKAVAELQKKVAEQQAKLDEQTELVVGNVGTDSVAFQRFVTSNYDFDGDVAVTVAGDIVATNEADNPTQVSTVVENFFANSGQSVTLRGNSISNQVFAGASPLSSAFTSATQAGRRYALLDQAQWQTLTELSNAPVSATEQREALVGTPNSIAGVDVKIQQAGTNINTVIVDGTAIEVPHGKFLCVANGDQFTNISTSVAHDWQLAPVAVDAAPAEPVAFEFPLVGRPWNFEKQVVEPGEALDAVIQVSLRRTR